MLSVVEFMVLYGSAHWQYISPCLAPGHKPSKHLSIVLVFCMAQESHNPGLSHPRLDITF